MLHSIFKEAPTDINRIDDFEAESQQTLCFRPGNRIMKGLIIADDNLESTVYSSNAIPPQFADCDSSTHVDYTLLDHRGNKVISRACDLKTNETFVFDTRHEELTRPFYGLFLYSMARQNYGSSRFNVCWSNGRSLTSTHELSPTGRPDVVIPILVDKNFLAGPNSYFVGLSNPDDRAISFSLCVFDVVTKQELIWRSRLEPNAVSWINASEVLFKEAVDWNGSGKYALRITSTISSLSGALSVNFFLHNRLTDIWTSNHI